MHETDPTAVDRRSPPAPGPRGTGLRALLGLAAVEPRFLEALEADRDQAIAASGLELGPAERRVLLAAPGPALRQAAASLAGHLDETDRRGFLAAASLALGSLSVSGLVGCRTTTRDEAAKRSSGVGPRASYHPGGPSEPLSEVPLDAAPKPPPPSPTAPPNGFGVDPERTMFTGIRVSRPDEIFTVLRDYTVTLADLEVVSGGIPVAAVRRLILVDGRSGLQDCQDRSGPSLRGRIDVVVEIDARGAVTGLRGTVSPPSARALGPCVAAALRRLRFPPPTQGDTAEIRIGLRFLPR
jgi:hypothetical protein